jgi:hypothetical protein
MTAANLPFVSERHSRTAAFIVNAPIDKAFPLFGPIREKEWAYGWNPEILFPIGPLVTEKMVFQTLGGLHGSAEMYTWTIVKFQPTDHIIEYQVTASDRLWFITVVCSSSGSSTNVSVTYSYTGLTPDGNLKNQKSIEDMFIEDLNDWERAINHYLRTGTQLH